MHEEQIYHVTFRHKHAPFMIHCT